MQFGSVLDTILDTVLDTVLDTGFGHGFRTCLADLFLWQDESGHIIRSQGSNLAVKHGSSAYAPCSGLSFFFLLSYCAQLILESAI